MRRIAITEFISLDGVIEAPGGEPDFKHSGWTMKFQDDEGFAYKGEEVQQFDALLLGRKTYEGFAAAWPGRGGDFADKMNSMRKYVVSTTLDDGGLTWENSTLISDDVPQEIAKIKDEDGGDILVAGSGTLAQTLMEHDLVDEYRLTVFPVVLGSGRRLFDGGLDGAALKRTYSKLLDSGSVIVHYEPAR